MESIFEQNSDQSDILRRYCLQETQTTGIGIGISQLYLVFFL